MIVKPYISFLNYDSDGKLVLDVNAIIAAMTGNKYYLTPSPTLLVVIAALTDFTNARAAAADGGTTLTAIKKAKRAALVSLIRALALYVQATCNGDLAVLKSSGFPTQKPQPQPIGPLPAPANLTVVLGLKTGELAASVAPVFGAANYNWSVAAATAPTVELQAEQTTAAEITFAGLTPGLTYIVKVNVLGTAGPSGWTTSAPKMVV